jgi:hypothetical protein
MASEVALITSEVFVQLRGTGEGRSDIPSGEWDWPELLVVDSVVEDRPSGFLLRAQAL